MVWNELVAHQHGIVSRRQAHESGLTDAAIKARIRSGRWQRVYRGVYATFSGPPSRPARLWAAVLNGGAGATLSHQTAAEMDGLQDQASEVIHVAVPGHRRVEPVPGLCIHRCARVEAARHPTRLPPRTRIEETVLDLVATSRSLDQGLSWIATACARRLTTPQRLAAALARRTQMRWRRELTRALGDVRAGAHSLLELRYLRNVERAHGLPSGTRQHVAIHRGHRQYEDVRYGQYATVLELDGRVGHVEFGRWRDMWRDNASAAGGDATLRYGWGDVTERPCRVAAQVAQVLGARGWGGRPHPCGPRCGLAEDSGRHGVHNPP